MYTSMLDGVRSGICNVGPRRVGDVDATTGIMWSPARRHHPIPAPKIGFSTATPHKTVLQIMALMSSST